MQRRNHNSRCFRRLEHFFFHSPDFHGTWVNISMIVASIKMSCYQTPCNLAVLLILSSSFSSSCCHSLQGYSRSNYAPLFVVSSLPDLQPKDKLGEAIDKQGKEMAALLLRYSLNNQTYCCFLSLGSSSDK